MSRRRLDERVVADGLAESRAIAQRLILAGVVRVDDHRVDKSGAMIRDDQVVTVDAPPRFVSRGGDKLDNGLEDFRECMAEHQLVIEGARAIDIGASTGGFTDCLLQRGASAVIAVDVGYGQLHHRLRSDSRVTVMERTNARYLEAAMLPWAPNLIVCDASFIPLATVLPAPLACMAPGFFGIILCKPQFEAGRERLAQGGKKGVITDPKLRSEIVQQTEQTLRDLRLEVLAVAEARPRGPKGNIEYVMLVHDARTRSSIVTSDT